MRESNYRRQRGAGGQISRESARINCAFVIKKDARRGTAATREGRIPRRRVCVYMCLGR